MDAVDLPFNRHLGMRLVGRSAALALTPREDHLNHAGTVHAGVIFALAEAAAGQTLIEQYPDLVARQTLVLLRSAEIKYRLPGTLSDGELQAQGTIAADVSEKFLERLLRKGKATLAVDVAVTQQENHVFQGQFLWFAADQN